MGKGRELSLVRLDSKVNHNVVPQSGKAWWTWPVLGEEK